MSFSQRSREDNNSAISSEKFSLRLRTRKSQSAVVNEGLWSSGMSLDVLAHVASQTLQNEPKSKQTRHKKVSLRNMNNIDVLNLDEILGLSEKMILNLFSEITSNEFSKTFTYMCQLMPKKCHKEFSSFGSEMRARADMKKHIYQHLHELEKQAIKSGRNKAIAVLCDLVDITQKSMADGMCAGPFTISADGSNDDTSKQFPLVVRTLDTSSITVNSEMLSIPICKGSATGLMSTKKSVGKKRGRASSPDDNSAAELHNKNLHYEVNTNSSMAGSGRNVGEESSTSSTNIGTMDFGNTEQIKSEPVEENDKNNGENEKFIIDLLSKTQPHHDHCYTTIFGKRNDDISNDSDEDLQQEKSEQMIIEELKALAPGKTVILDNINSKTKSIPAPILFLRHRSPNEIVPMVSAEEIVNNQEDIQNESPEEEDTNGKQKTIITAEKPYLPMPRSVLAKRGRLSDICDISAGGSNDAEIIKKKKVLNPLGREGRKGNLDWEPKLALKFIKELKGRRKDENIPLTCQICNDKIFTASSTLMYHYRSHAGIKPFVCLICNTTFTRQHSLNYHMLIHNNQSRFTCKDCGRKFRHPSHFKEHLRRHTGETPFECLDCGQKFKTRNTYKRHLKTRHGKLLTATGIHIMSVEEFAKVGTRRYLIPKLADISYRMPELTFTRIKQNSSEQQNNGSFKEHEKQVFDLIIKSDSYKIVKEVKKLSDKADISVSDIEDSAILEELKADINKETDTDDSDPELDNILEVLTQNDARHCKLKAEIKEEVSGESDDQKQAFKSGLFDKYREKAAVCL